ncbi:hypothetical protein ACFX2G_015136 [Malus domestica]
MKKVHITLGILVEYREWRWLLNPLRWEKCGLPSREEIKRINADALALLIVVVEPAMNEGRKKRSSSPTQEMLVEKKLKASSIAHEGPHIAKRLVIDLTSSKGKKDEAARFERMTPAMLKIASTIAEKIAQSRGFVVLLVPKSVLRHPLRVKSSAHLERLVTMKCNKVDPDTKVAPMPILLAFKTSLPAEKEETTCVGCCEKSTKPVSGEAVEICDLSKPDLLEDVDAYANLVDGVKGVIYPSSFAKHTTQYRRTALLAMMQKTTILAAEFMLIDQEDTKAAKEMATTIAAEAYSSAEKIKRLEFKLVILKGFRYLCPYFSAA